MINRLGFIQTLFLVGITHLLLSSFIFHKYVPSSMNIPGDTFFYLLISDGEYLKKKVFYSHGLAMLPFVIIALIFFNKEKGIYGDARFAFEWEVKKNVKPGVSGMFLCYLGRLKVIIQGPFHHLITAETRAGKGVSWVVPTILTWSDSMIIFDLKGELYKYTSWFKKISGHKVYFLDFMTKDGKGDCNNVFDYIPDNRNERISFVQKVAEFIQPTPSSGDPMWSGEARSLFTGLVLLAHQIPYLNLSFGTIYRMLHTEDPTHIYLQNMIEEYKDILDPVCKMELWSYIQTPDKTRGGIKKQLTSSLKIFANPTVDAATSNSSFDLRKIKKDKMTIYVSAPVDYLEAVAPVVRLFFQFSIDLNLKEPIEIVQKKSFIVRIFNKVAIDLNFKKAIKENKEHNCLFLLDEFLAIGYMGVIANKIAYMTGYGLQLMLIIQSKAQLRNEYKELATAIEENCVIRSFLTPNIRKTSEELSNELGFNTIRKITSRSRKWMGIFPGHETTGEVKKALMLPEELMRLSDDKCIVFIKGIWPILGKRAVYYKDSNFKNKIKPPILKRILDIPFHKVLEGPEVSHTIEVNLDEINLEGISKEVILTDEEVVKASQEYFKQMGIKL